MKSTKAPQTGFEFSVSACPKTIKQNLALVRATFILLSSCKNLKKKKKNNKNLLLFIPK